MMIPTITVDNFGQHLYDYTLALYGDEIESSRSQCPYNLNLDSDDYSHKQLCTWFIFIRINPQTGITILEEFTRRFVNDVQLAAMMLRARGAFYGQFTVTSKVLAHVTVTGKRKNNAVHGIITAKSSTGKTYRIMTTHQTFMDYNVGVEFAGIIHPWLEDGTYKTCGIMTVVIPSHIDWGDPNPVAAQNILSTLNPDVISRMLKMKRKMDERVKKRDETRHISQKQTLASILSNFNLIWIDGISSVLKINTTKMLKAEKIDAISSVLTSDRLRGVISSLSKNEKDCLVHVTKKGGIIRYTILQKQFGKDDTADLWTPYRPTSTIGSLRKRGLFVVGVLKRGSKNRYVVIPEDVLACMYSIWPDWPRICS